MPEPFGHHNNLIGQTSHGTHVPSSLSLGSSNSLGITPIDNHGAVDINLALNSATSFPNQNQAIPISGQLRFRQNGTEPGLRRSIPSFPGNMHVNNISHSHSMQPQNSLNINIFMANNSSININLLNNDSSSQFARNNPFASSSTNTPNQNNAISCPSSNFQQMFLPPNQEQPINNVMETNESPRFTTSYTQYSSPRVTTVSGNPLYTSVRNHNQEIPVAIPCFRQHADNLSPFRRPTSLSGQSIHCQGQIISQSSSNHRLSSRFFPRENRDDFQAFPSSTMNAADEQSLDYEGRNDKSNEDELNPQLSLQTPNNVHETKHSDIQALPQVPYQNGNKAEPQRSPAQATSHGPKFQPHLQAQKHPFSPKRCKSHPYIKYGPYTCPKCHDTFPNANSYAAHVQKHYKDESQIKLLGLTSLLFK